MWSKVANAFRRSDDSTSGPTQQDGVNHPSHDESLSDNPAEPAGVLSPPDSPGKGGKRSLLRRGSRLMEKENGVSLSLAKRVKSSLHLNSNMNESNMDLTSTTKTDSGAQPVFGSVRSIFGHARRPSAMQMQAAMNRSDDALNRISVDEPRPPSPSPEIAIQGPLTPLDARQFGSVRSILRDKNTPGSGQNVRFFSRDAYRLISPNASASADNTGSSGDPVDPPFMQRIQEMSPDRDGTSQDTTRYLSANNSPNMFSPASVYASPDSVGFDGHPSATSTPFVTPNTSQPLGHDMNFMSVPPPQLSGIFDFSGAHEHGVHAIHGTEETELRDTAMEVDQFGRPIRNSSPPTLGIRLTVNAQPENRVSSHSTASSMSIETPNSVNGSDKSLRRLSDSEDTPFHSLADDGGEKHTLSGRAASSLGLHKVFKRDNTPIGDGRPKLEFPGSASSRVRALSDRVFSRPSLEDPKQKVETTNLASSNGESPDPFSVDAINYYNPAAGFPKTPPRVGHVRSDSGVSGVSMNSGRSVSALSHRSGSSRSSHASATQTRGVAEEEMISSLRTQLAFHQELATQYELDIRARDAHAALMNQKLQAHEAEAERRARAMRGMRRRVAELERAAVALEEQAERSAQESFERELFEGANGDAVKTLHQQMVDLERERVEMVNKEKEARAELDREREHFKNEIASLEARITETEVEWTEKMEAMHLHSFRCENRKAELEDELAAACAAKAEAERERDELREEFSRLGTKGVDDSSAIANLEDQVKALREERQNALEDARHFEQLLHEYEAEANNRARRRLDDDEVERLHAEIASMHREQARMQTEQARNLSEADIRASDAVELRNDAARRQAAAEAEAKELRERLAKLQEETDKLKINVQVLKQQSADQDVKIVQLEKQHDQDTEDKLGLNIALDSKQQELELLKRSMGVRGTAGATPAVPNRVGGRRDSAAFKTPVPLRPMSSLSDGAKRPPSSLSDTERSERLSGGAVSTVKPTFGSNTRVNAGSKPTVPTTMKKGPRHSDTSLSAPPGRARASTADSVTKKTPGRPGGIAPVGRRVVSPDPSVHNRRASLAISGIEHMSDTSSAQSDKENETPKAKPINAAAARRMSTQPLAVPA